MVKVLTKAGLDASDRHRDGYEAIHRAGEILAGLSNASCGQVSQPLEGLLRGHAECLP